MRWSLITALVFFIGLYMGEARECPELEWKHECWTVEEFLDAFDRLDR